MVDVIKGQPITLPNGTVIHPGNGAKGKANIIDKQVDDDDDDVDDDDGLVDDVDDTFENGLTFKRNLADLPSDPKKLNPLMLILAYHMWGLDITSIGMLLNIEDEQVESIMKDEMFTSMRRELLEAVRYTETGNIHGYLTQNSLKAAKTVVKHMKSKNGDRALAAAKDVLDRSGFRPSDRVEHVHRFEDDLRIVYIKEQNLPMIDINVKELTDGNGS